MENEQLLSEIKKIILQQEPGAEIILYGSYARGDFNMESDIDVLILLHKEKVTYTDEKRISYPLYELEVKAGKIISPLILEKDNWENKFTITPLYQNIQREGKVL